VDGEKGHVPVILIFLRLEGDEQGDVEEGRELTERWPSTWRLGRDRYKGCATTISA
jgi:hypothetical protein